MMWWTVRDIGHPTMPIYKVLEYQAERLLGDCGQHYKALPKSGIP